MPSASAALAAALCHSQTPSTAGATDLGHNLEFDVIVFRPGFADFSPILSPPFLLTRLVCRRKVLLAPSPTTMWLTSLPSSFAFLRRAAEGAARRRCAAGNYAAAATDNVFLRPTVRHHALENARAVRLKSVFWSVTHVVVGRWVEKSQTNSPGASSRARAVIVREAAEEFCTAGAAAAAGTTAHASATTPALGSARAEKGEIWDLRFATDSSASALTGIVLCGARGVSHMAHTGATADSLKNVGQATQPALGSVV